MSFKSKLSRNPVYQCEQVMLVPNTLLCTALIPILIPIMPLSINNRYDIILPYHATLIVSTGHIITRTINVIPEGYLLCDGQEISRETYSLLFKVIGTTYGLGNGIDTFLIPNGKENTYVYYMIKT